VAAEEATVAVGSLIGAAADRLGITPMAVSLGLVAVLAAGVGGWWAVRAPDPRPVEEAMPSVFESPIPTTGPTTTTLIDEILLVDVGGAVVSPGVHELRPGDRVVDAIRASGGLTTDADRRRLNMAMTVADGQRIWVPLKGEDEPREVVPEGGSTKSSSAGPGARAVKVDINVADSAELQTLPGIGPSLAASIISYRTRQGPFAGVDGLTKVPGIGPAKMQQLVSMVRV